MITLKQLRYLEALAQHRHFGRAAEACAVTQPALSMQIRDLEQSLGVELVERRTGDVMLTTVGTQVVQRGIGVLTATRDLVDFARHANRLLTGRLKIGIIPSLAPYVLPKFLPRLQRRYPELQLELRETQTHLLIEELLQGGIDVVMLALPITRSEIETMRLFEDAFLLAVPADDARTPSARVRLRDIEGDRLILLEEGHCLREQALSYCAGARVETPVGLGATSLATVMQMVANGYGITLVPKVAAEVEARDGRVKLLRFAKPEPGRTIGLAFRRTSPRKADFVAFGELVTEALGVGRGGDTPRSFRRRSEKKRGGPPAPRSA